MSWLSILGVAWNIIAKFFGKSDIQKSLETGEALGKAEVNAQTSKDALSEAQRAVAAGRDAGNADANGGVRKPHPGDRPWDPDALD